MKKQLITLLLLGIFFQTTAQLADSTQSSTSKSLSFSGTLGITNNGFSFIPAFTLDAPAVSLLVSANAKKFSYHLETSFAIDGRPWISSFITRYKLLSSPKQELSLGVMFPSVSFIKRIIQEPSGEKEILEAQQSISPELNYSRSISKKTVIGLSLMKFFGLGNIFPKGGDFVSIWTNIDPIPLLATTSLSMNQQLFHLSIDSMRGWYYSGTITLSKRDFPFAISSMYYQTIQSNLGGKSANWNLSILYKF